MAGEPLDINPLIQETRANIERLLRLLEERDADFSHTEIERAVGEGSQARGLAQSLQVASCELGYLVHYTRYGSRSDNIPSSATQSSARDHEIQLEEGRVRSESDSQSVRETITEPAGDTEVANPISDFQDIESRMPARSLISGSESRQAEQGLDAPTMMAIQPIPNLAAESPGHCTICFDEITTLCILQPCDHTFDLDCLMPWLVSVYRESHDEPALRCPLCRQTIDTIRHSITGDGYSTMRVVGPYFRQQFPRHHFRRPREDLLRPFSVIAIHRFDDDLGERFPGNGTVASYFPHGPLTDELRRRQRAELRLNARRANVQPGFCTRRSYLR